MRAEPKLREGPIATDRLTLYALRSTPKRPEGRVLLLGGSNFDLRLKRQFLTTNLAARFEILTYEPRGIGRTEQPEGAWDMADYAADAAALMDAVGWDQADIVGESFGGMTALHVCHLFPDRVARVAVISATAGGRGRGSEAARYREHRTVTRKSQSLSGPSGRADGLRCHVYRAFN